MDSLQSDLENFSSYLLSEKGLSLNTLEAYRRDILTFFFFLKERQIFERELVQQQHIIDFLSIKKSKNYATASISRALIALKVFFKFLKREGLLSQNKAALLEIPKAWQLLPDVLSIDEIEALLEQPDQNTYNGARDRAILEVLYACGIRVSELCSLKIADVDDSFIRVKGKGKKERVVPIGRKAIQAIDRYLAYRDGLSHQHQEALFIGRQNSPIDRITVWYIVKKYARQAGIKKTIFPHTFRHTFATHLLDHGAELRVIQEMLGHADINSTDRYTHVSSSRLQESFQAFHPRN